MRARLTAGILVVVVAAAAAAAAVLVWRPAIAPIRPPTAGSFDAQLVARGRELALVGDCDVCHTRPGGPAFAGGRALPTPFGTLYASNVTPDPQTGIGTWSEAAFVRAMRAGVRRDGEFIYPAHPYDHFTRLTDADLAALYAYVMTRPAFTSLAPAPALNFPFNVRALLAGWDLLFLNRGPYRMDPTQSVEWNDGAYLVQGLGHCGACHTPRNVLGAEQKDRALAGGMAEGWYAPALNQRSPALIPWTQASLFRYLRTGRDASHGIAGGPMADVTRNLAQAREDDVQAIATYAALMMGEPSEPHEAKGRALIARTEQQSNERRHAIDGERVTDLGEVIYVASCAQCHEPWRTNPPQNAGRNLALQSAVSAPDPFNLIHTILAGIHPLDNQSRTVMPDFAGALTDTQIADLARYVRRTFSDQQPWDDLAAKVRAVRASTAMPSRQQTPIATSADLPGGE
jgi:mono/diheme cytochrome c family protein